MKPTQQLHDLGQSLWLYDASRSRFQRHCRLAVGQAIDSPESDPAASTHSLE
jgi:hypothetical protein